MPRLIAHGEGAQTLEAGAVVAEAGKAGAGGIDLSQVDRATVSNTKSLYDHFASHSPPKDALAFLRLNELGPGIPLETISLKYWKYERNFAGVDAAPVKGYASLVEDIWKSVEIAATNPVKVVLNAEVTALEHLAAAGTVKVTTNDPRDSASALTTYNVPIVLSTIPLGVLKEKVTTPFFSPPLPWRIPPCLLSGTMYPFPPSSRFACPRPLLPAPPAPERAATKSRAARAHVQWYIRDSLRRARKRSSEHHPHASICPPFTSALAGSTPRNAGWAIADVCETISRLKSPSDALAADVSS